MLATQIEHENTHLSPYRRAARPIQAINRLVCLRPRIHARRCATVHCPVADGRHLILTVNTRGGAGIDVRVALANAERRQQYLLDYICLRIRLTGEKHVRKASCVRCAASIRARVPLSA